jgi:thiamine-monophosphate kinase
MEAKDVGEFGLIDRLLARLGSARDGVVVAAGDDAAAVERPGRRALATADVLLEGVHFEIGLSSPSDVGWKALAANLSDVAAMGGLPRYALVSLGAPASTPVATREQIYDGLGECARAFSVSIVGGDTVAADRLIVSVAVLGEPGPAGIVTRAGAKAGDLACVTGAVGAAAAGLALLRAAEDDAAAAALIELHPALAAAHRRPTPRVREGLAAATGGAAAMIDVSDGLAADVGHICEASSLGVRISEVPTAGGVGDVAAWLGRDPAEFALGGGDDYELAIAVAPERLATLRDALARTPVTVIGEFVDAPERLFQRADGTTTELAKLGWDHFA